MHGPKTRGEYLEKLRPCPEAATKQIPQPNLHQEEYELYQASGPISTLPSKKPGSRSKLPRSTVTQLLA